MEQCVERVRTITASFNAGVLGAVEACTKLTTHIGVPVIPVLVSSELFNVPSPHSPFVLIPFMLSIAAVGALGGAVAFGAVSSTLTGRFCKNLPPEEERLEKIEDEIRELAEEAPFSLKLGKAAVFAAALTCGVLFFDHTLGGKEAQAPIATQDQPPAYPQGPSVK